MPARKSPRYNATFALVAFAVAAVCWSGFVLKDDMTGRLIFGLVWSFVGVLWLGQYFEARKELRSSRGSLQDSGSFPRS